jgi:hypothetical protein
LTVSLICCGVAMVLADSCHSRHTDRLVHLLLASGIIWQLRSEFRASPGMYLGSVDLRLFKAGVAINALILVLAFTLRRTLAPIWFPAFLLISTLLGWWVLTASPHPAIDVVVVHRDAIDALSTGTIRMPSALGTFTGRTRHSTQPAKSKVIESSLEIPSAAQSAARATGRADLRRLPIRDAVGTGGRCPADRLRSA